MQDSVWKNLYFNFDKETWLRWQYLPFIGDILLNAVSFTQIYLPFEVPQNLAAWHFPSRKERQSQEICPWQEETAKFAQSKSQLLQPFPGIRLCQLKDEHGISRVRSFWSKEIHKKRKNMHVFFLMYEKQIKIPLMLQLHSFDIHSSPKQL